MLGIQRIQTEPLSLFKKMACQKVTNLSNRGLISEDRSTKATLVFTIPRSIFKSSAMDISPKILDFDNCRTSLVFLQLSALGLRDKKSCPILVRLRVIRGNYHCFVARFLTQRHSVITQQMVASQHCLFRQLQMSVV